MKKPFHQGLFLAFTVLICDQVSKWWMIEYVMNPPQVISLTPFCNLVFAWNRGISFGLFSFDSSYSRWILTLLALSIAAFLSWCMYRSDKVHQTVALGMIIGGALGNVVDRIIYGAVYDFLDFHIAGHHWPAFNLADSGVLVGALILVLDSFFAKAENTNSDNTSETS